MNTIDELVDKMIKRQIRKDARLWEKVWPWLDEPNCQRILDSSKEIKEC